MKGNAVGYQKLPGRRRGIIRNASLWAAGDHLLAIDSWRFTEHYKRYYFADIQAITLERKVRITTGPLLWSLGVTALIGFPLWLLITFVLTTTQASGIEVPFEVWRYYTLFGRGALWLCAAIVVYHVCAWILLSCECRIHTATSSDELRSLHRSWTAKKVLRQIDARIRSVQGELQEDWESRLAELPSSPHIAGPRGSLSASPGGTAVRAFHLPLFAALMASTALSGVWRFLVPSRAADGVLTLLVVACAVFTIFYAVRLKGRVAKMMSGLAFAAVVVLALAYASATLYSLRRSAMENTQTDTGFASFLAQTDSPLVTQAPAMGAIALGVAGILVASRLLRKAPGS